MTGHAILIVLPDGTDVDYAEGLAGDIRGTWDLDPTVIGWPPDPDEIRTLLDPT